MRTAAAQPKARSRAAILMLWPLAVLAAGCGSSSETSTVTAPAQARCALATQTESTSFAPDGGSGTLRVSTERECTWTARTDATWIAVGSPSSGQGDGTVPFTVAPNDTPDSRQAAIIVNDQRQAIAQQGRPCRFELSPEQVSLPATGGDRTVSVSASSSLCAWTAASDAPWIAILSGREGRGNGSVTFRVAPAAGPARSGTLRVAGETVRVEQGTGCTFTVTPATLDVGPEGGERALQVEASSAECTWTASTNAPWITIGGAGGAGSGTLSVRVEPTTGPQRSGTVTVAGHTVHVNQGTGCTIDVNPAAASVPAQGGTVSVTVESGAGCAWTAATTQNWISITAGAQGSGSGRVDATVAANQGPARSGSVSVAGRVATIDQASGCTYSIAPASQNIPGASTTGAISITTAPGCPWTAASSADWVTLSQSSGTGPGELRFSAAANESPARTATIAVAGHTFTLNQASLCTYALLPPFHEFGPAGGNGNVLVVVTGACTWTATSTADWIQMTAGLSGAGNGLVQFSVLPNPGPARTGVLIIAGEQYRVTQGGQ